MVHIDEIIQLLEDCRSDPNPGKKFDGSLITRKQYGIYEVDSLTIIPIALFQISTTKGRFNGTKITEYLKWNKKDLIGFYTFKNGQFEGLLDWSDAHHFNLGKECLYFNVNNDNMVKNESYWLGYKFLKEQRREVSFLFNVKYFIETLWFIENDIVYVLDLKEMQVYDPDQFIQTKCNDAFIQDVVNGGRVPCNY